jgi:hypothetical protein
MQTGIANNRWARRWCAAIVAFVIGSVGLAVVDEGVRAYFPVDAFCCVLVLGLAFNGGGALYLIGWAVAWFRGRQRKRASGEAERGGTETAEIAFRDAWNGLNAEAYRVERRGAGARGLSMVSFAVAGASSTAGGECVGMVYGVIHGAGYLDQVAAEFAAFPLLAVGVFWVGFGIAVVTSE